MPRAYSVFPGGIPSAGHWGWAKNDGNKDKTHLKVVNFYLYFFADVPIFSIHRIEFGLRAINRIPLTVRELVLVKIFTTARVPRALALWALKTYKIFGTRTHSKRLKILLTSCLMRILGKDKKGNPTVILKPLKKRIIVGFESFRWTPKLVTSAQTMVCASEPLVIINS